MRNKPTYWWVLKRMVIVDKAPPPGKGGMIQPLTVKRKPPNDSILETKKKKVAQHYRIPLFKIQNSIYFISIS